MKGQLGDIRAIIGIIFTIVIGGIIINALYNASVQTTGANSAASQTIGAEANSFNLFASMVVFLLDPIHDIELIVGILAAAGIGYKLLNPN